MENKETLDEIIRQGNTMYLHNPYVDLEPLVPYATYANDLTKKQLNQVVVPVRTEPKYQNNEPCPCGSGNKYKKCCKTK